MQTGRARVQVNVSFESEHRMNDGFARAYHRVNANVGDSYSNGFGAGEINRALKYPATLQSGDSDAVDFGGGFIHDAGAGNGLGPIGLEWEIEHVVVMMVQVSEESVGDLGIGGIGFDWLGDQILKPGATLIKSTGTGIEARGIPDGTVQFNAIGGDVEFVVTILGRSTV